VPDEPRSKTLATAWVLLVVLGALLVLVAIGSFAVAYRRTADVIAGTELARLEAVDSRLPDALRGRRATSAALSFSTGVFLIWIALIPFRRRERWAWRAVASAMGGAGALSLARIPALDMRQGFGTSAIVFLWVALALIISWRDFR
jgi:hypothetical protein